MQITDPIADLLTRIRNASTAKHPSVEIPASNMKKAICQILVDEGYIKGMQVKNDTVQGTIVVTLKYQANGEPVIAGLRRVSKPGLRIYTNCEDMPKVMKGLGTAIISTSKGIMTDKAARAEHVGGEVLAYVWEERGKRQCRELEENPSSFLPVSLSLSMRQHTLSPSRAPRAA